MKRVQFIVLFLTGVVLIGGSRFACAQYQYGRIDSVKKSVTTSTKVWVVNTPLDEERTQYTISAHVQDRIITGTYELSATESEPRQNGSPAMRCSWRSAAIRCICGRRPAACVCILRNGRLRARCGPSPRKKKNGWQNSTSRRKRRNR